MKLKAHGVTDSGRTRESNEDSFLIDDQMGVYIVCDGLGGHTAGEVASQKTCEIIHRVLSENYKTLATYASEPTFYNRAKAVTVVEVAIQTACREIYWMGQADPDRSGMSCTAALLVAVGQAAILAHVGNARVYICRQGAAHKLTDDHVRSLDSFDPSKNQRPASPNAEALLARTIGSQEYVQPDSLHIELTPGDLFLLCTDGLSGYLDRKTAEPLPQACKAGKPQAVPEMLVQYANKQGGRDNVTAVVVSVEADDNAEAGDVARKVEVLRSIPLFSSLSYPELVKVLNIVRVKTFEPGQQLFREGEVGDELYISLSGTMQISKGGQAIAELERGSFVGEMALIDQSPRSADVFAKDSVRVMIIRRNDFFLLLKNEPNTAVRLLWAFMQVLNQRLRATSSDLMLIRRQGGESFEDMMLADIDEATMPDLSDVDLDEN